MVTSPWIEPSDVTGYTEYESVVNRDNDKLKVDITRAEQAIRNYTHNDFSDYETLPEAVKTATILLAESFAYNAKATGTKKSETYDDYSYTVENVTITPESLGLGGLLDEFIKVQSTGRVTFKMRAL